LENNALYIDCGCYLICWSFLFSARKQIDRSAKHYSSGTKDRCCIKALTNQKAGGRLESRLAFSATTFLASSAMLHLAKDLQNGRWIGQMIVYQQQGQFCPTANGYRNNQLAGSLSSYPRQPVTTDERRLSSIIHRLSSVGGYFTRLDLLSF